MDDGTDHRENHQWRDEPQLPLSARDLALRALYNGSGSGPPSPAPSNLYLAAGAMTPAELKTCDRTDVEDVAPHHVADRQVPLPAAHRRNRPVAQQRAMATAESVMTPDAVAIDG